MIKEIFFDSVIYTHLFSFSYPSVLAEPYPPWGWGDGGGGSGKLPPEILRFYNF